MTMPTHDVATVAISFAHRPDVSDAEGKPFLAHYVLCDFSAHYVLNDEAELCDCEVMLRSAH